MPNTCEKCGNVFLRKSQFDAHMERKTPCKKAIAVQVLEQKIEQLEGKGPFRETSLKFHESISKEDRQTQGIFFTPKKARDLLFEKLRELGVSPRVILEPAFGSGEFLEDMRALYPTATVHAVEKNESLFKSGKGEGLVHADFLEYHGCPAADLIVGNPPYFLIDTSEMTRKEKAEFAEKNQFCMVGRPNIYISFLYKCVTEHLADDGHIAFVIPTSLMNCSYYQPMRNHIAKYMTIKAIQELDVKYYEAGQDTMLLILQKKAGGTDYLYTMNGCIYMSPRWRELEEMFKGTTRLSALGFAAKTGEVVWNQEKEKMADAGTLVIYNTNIKDGKLVLGTITSKVGTKSEKKRQYIKGFEKPAMKGPAILVNRGHGNGSYKFNYVLVPESMGEFYAENHVNVIYPTSPEAAKKMDVVLKSFADPRTSQFFDWFVGNGSFNTTELQSILPIFV